jgi:hypothetical protein
LLLQLLLLLLMVTILDWRIVMKMMISRTSNRTAVLPGGIIHTVFIIIKVIMFITDRFTRHILAITPLQQVSGVGNFGYIVTDTSAFIGGVQNIKSNVIFFHTIDMGPQAKSREQNNQPSDQRRAPK